MPLLPQIGIVSSRLLTRDILILRRIGLSSARLLRYKHIRSQPKQATKRQNCYFFHSGPRGRPKLPVCWTGPRRLLFPRFRTAQLAVNLSYCWALGGC